MFVYFTQGITPNGIYNHKLYTLWSYYMEMTLNAVWFYLHIYIFAIYIVLVILRLYSALLLHN